MHRLLHTLDDASHDFQTCSTRKNEPGGRKREVDGINSVIMEEMMRLGHGYEITQKTCGAASQCPLSSNAIKTQEAIILLLYQPTSFILIQSIEH